jgi:N-acetylneuraminic acid mutarotase
VRGWQATNSWQIAAEMSTPRSFIGLGVIGNDAVYAIGGYDGEDYLQVSNQTAAACQTTPNQE